ncbi:hypothetical protein C8Q76DRAFT_860398 [Earliella scabrosa]|nr:hypothetical protein C8Q76DRAFT_860398 [Earliella scabrosa]
MNHDGNRIPITRETACSELVDLDVPPRCWTIPRPNGETGIAYRLNLTLDDAEKWTTDKGELMSMLAIIKREDQDAWGGGSAGSLRKTVTVYCLDDDYTTGVECQQASHVCQGVYHCPHLLPSLLEDCERFEANMDEVAALSALRGEQNAAQRTDIEASALTFYNMVQDKHKCTFKNQDGIACTGKPTLRSGKQVSFNGKTYWIGCSGWHASHPDRGRAHKSWTIPAEVDENLLFTLFETGGVLSLNDVNTPLQGKTCTYIAARRSGGKGASKCAYSHCINGKVEKPKLILRPCSARLQVWYPVDRSDRRAIVVVKGPHNHPTPRHEKPTLESSRK